MKKLLTTTLILATLTSCATQRYGRQSEVSGAEQGQLTCKEIKLEIAKTESFLQDLKIQRSSTNLMHVAGFLGDFGIGNAIEGDAAENSGLKRLKQLNELKNTKNCK